jgi:DNA helicase-2/ATP-dependent DNA helicase PcrA
MYVAITRARQRLYLSFSQTRMLHGQTRYNVKSRFFDELPEGALKWLTPRQQGFGSGYAREYQQAWAARQRPVGIVGAGRVSPRQPAAPHAAGDGRARPGGPARGAVGVPHQVRRRRDHTLEGSGADARAQVNFGRHGSKWLALAIAKLTPRGADNRTGDRDHGAAGQQRCSCQRQRNRVQAKWAGVVHGKRCPV